MSELADLWTRAYAGYAGLIAQTPDAWRWRVLARPGLTAADVQVVADASDRPLGYGVIDATGAVLEVAVDPAADPATRDAVAERVVAALEARCRARGSEAIRFVLPEADGADDAVQRALRAGGYWSEPSPSFTATVADVAALLEAVLPARLASAPPGWGPTFRIDVTRGADWPSPRLTTRVAVAPRLEVVREEPGATEPAVGCTVALDLHTLNYLFMGRTSFDDALASGAVRVHPPERAADAATLLGLVALRAPWYSALADGR